MNTSEERAPRYELVAEDLAVRTRNSELVFNRGMRRGRTVVVAGDQPRFALATHIADASPEPSLIKLVDGRLFVEADDKRLWLDEMESSVAVHRASRVDYELKDPQSPVRLILTVSQAEDWGLVARLTLTAIADCGVTLGCRLGGPRVFGHPFNANYFDAPETGVAGARMEVDGAFAAVTLPQLPQRLYGRMYPCDSPRAGHDAVTWRTGHRLKEEQSVDVAWLFEIADDISDTHELSSLEDAESLIAEAGRYYSRITDARRIRTPSETLNAAFATALVNLDYVFDRTAWLEGVHFWAAPWANNFQISAATVAGREDQSRIALLWLLGADGHLCPPRLANGEPFEDGIMGDEDGLPYFLHQLAEYIAHSGDLEVAEPYWEKIEDAIASLFGKRTRDRQLLNWHRSCNAFLYQADHLALPGYATSPSVFMAAVLRRLASVAESLGRHEAAVGFVTRAETIELEVRNLLWEARDGAYLSHLDWQGLEHRARYYTDLVYPALYGVLDEAAYLSLGYLERRLVYEANGRTLMRVGELKPSVFGNDNVLPTQMAEASRALARAGRNNVACSLLEAVAIAATIDTDAPLNFPERMSESGRGEANYIFGNPAGAFAHAVVEGLFGLQKRNRTIEWRPSFPDDWPEASIQLPWVETSFSTRLHGPAFARRYEVNSPSPVGLVFSVALLPSRALTVHVNGRPHEFETKPGYARTWVEITAAPAKHFVIEVEGEVVSRSLPEAVRAEVDSAPSLVGLEADAVVHDPQGIFSSSRTTGTEMHAELAAEPGEYDFFIETKTPSVLWPVHLRILPDFTVRPRDPQLDGDGSSVSIGLEVQRRRLGTEAELRCSFAGEVQSLWLAPHEGEVRRRLYFARAVDGDLFAWSVYEGGKPAVSGSTVISAAQRGKTSRRTTATSRPAWRPLVLDTSRNSDRIFATSRWRYGQQRLSRAAVKAALHAAGRPDDFELQAEDKLMAVVSFARSDRVTTELRHDGHANRVRIPVGCRAAAVILLYANEVDSRLTGSRVGHIALSYAGDGTQTFPLISGLSIDSLHGAYASETEALPITTVPGESDHINVLQLPCRSRGVLESVEIVVDVADVEFGLIAASFRIAP